MVFVVSKLLWLLLRPSTVLALLPALGLAIGLTGAWRLGRALVVLGAALWVAVVVLPLDQWALRPLEDRFVRPAAPPAHLDGILVLGGAVDGRLSADRGMPSLTAAAERLTEFAALARRYPQARLAFTGGTGDLLPGAVAEAGPARALLIALGVPPGRVEFEAASRSTWENALYARDLVQPQPGQTWLLVTSAAHMPRALGAFRGAGWPVLPWPVGYKTTRADHLAELATPVGERLVLLDLAAHEWTGLLAYWLLGRSPVLFPAPEG